MGPDQVDICLGHGTHTDLVIGSGEKGGKCAGKCNRTVTGGAAHGHSNLQQWAKTSVMGVSLNDSKWM